MYTLNKQVFDKEDAPDTRVLRDKHNLMRDVSFISSDKTIEELKRENEYLRSQLKQFYQERIYELEAKKKEIEFMDGYKERVQECCADILKESPLSTIMRVF